MNFSYFALTKFPWTFAKQMSTVHEPSGSHLKPTLPSHVFDVYLKQCHFFTEILLTSKQSWQTDNSVYYFSQDKRIPIILEVERPSRATSLRDKHWASELAVASTAVQPSLSARSELQQQAHASLHYSCSRLTTDYQPLSAH